METKMCSRCGEDKPVSEFYARPDRGTLKSRCKKCCIETCAPYITIICEQCGKTVRKRAKIGSKYCSKECKYASKDMGGKVPQNLGFTVEGMGKRKLPSDIRLGSWEKEQLEIMKDKMEQWKS
jgi:hypothetical protein